jgi:5-methyltetrahydrofolate--homocysteine methyltransferase
MPDFLTTLGSGRVLLMDGAMGTELQRAGIREGECLELWNIEQAAKVRGVHQAYVDAGADCVLTNTFQANPRALAKHGLTGRWAEINHAATEIARSVCGPQHFVLADLGPGISAELRLNRRQAYKEFIQSFGSADGVLLETASNRDDLISMLFVRHEADRVPFLFSLAYGRNACGYLCTCVGQYPENKPPEFYAERARDWHLDALGVNCGREIGPDEVVEIVRRYRRVTDLPLFVRPNAGTPRRGENGWVYPLTPRQLAERMPELLDAGVTMVGGCCGTTAEHIAALRPVIDDWNARHGFPAADAPGA